MRPLYGPRRSRAYYAITVLRDAVIPLERELGGAALRMMSRNMSARVLTTRQWHNEIP